MEAEWNDPYKYQLQLNNQLNWNQENNLNEQIREMTDEIDGSLVGMSGDSDSTNNNYVNSNNSKGKSSKDKKGKAPKNPLPEELILRPGENSLAFADSLDLPYDLQNTAEELYHDIRQGSKSLETYGVHYYVEEFSYDPAGNVTQKTNGWGAIDYQYNYENRLISTVNIAHPHFLGASKPFRGEVSYTYDALGRKVNKTVDPKHGNKVDVTSFMYDGRGVNVLAEYQVEIHSKGKPGNKNNIYDKGKVNYYNEYYYGNGLAAINYLKHPDRGRVHPNVTFYHKDALCSVSMITGKNGQLVDRYEYDAYGNPYAGRFEQGNNMNPYGFTGQRYEVQTGVYSFAFRTYNPRSMRWMTQDPVRNGANWYQYVSGDPVNLWDPLGLCKDESFSYNTKITTKVKIGPLLIENEISLYINIPSNSHTTYQVDNDGNVKIKGKNYEMIVTVEN